LKSEVGLFKEYYVGTPKHPEFWFYFTYLKDTGFKYLIYLLPLNFIPFFISKNKKLKTFLLFLIIQSIALFFGYSSSVTKNEWYISVIFPFFSLSLSVSIYLIFESLNDLIKNRVAFKITTFVLIIIFIAFFYKSYIFVYNKNQLSSYIYTPEREGLFFRECVEEYPTKFNYQIIIPSNKDQIKFYTKRFEYKNSQAKITLSNNTDKVNKNSLILVCKENLIDSIENNYSFRIIKEGKYCKLYEIKQKNFD